MENTDAVFHLLVSLQNLEMNSILLHSHFAPASTKDLEILQTVMRHRALAMGLCGIPYLPCGAGKSTGSRDSQKELYINEMRNCGLKQILILVPD